jgi:hypothetical protein
MTEQGTTVKESLRQQAESTQERGPGMGGAAQVFWSSHYVTTYGGCQTWNYGI